jgi:tetratricopeptide (TPR) repeat protein
MAAMVSCRPLRQVLSPLLTLVLLVMCVPHARAEPRRGGATAEDRQARDEFQAGRSAFDDGRYEDALPHFEKAYELSPRPQLLYNIAKTEDFMGKRREARDHYRRFLSAVPDTQNRGQVERRIAELDTEIAREPPAPVVPTPEEVAQAAEPPPASAPTPARAPLMVNQASPERSERIYKKWWLWTAVGAVVAGGVVAAILATRNSDAGKADPTLLDNTTRVREL